MRLTAIRLASLLLGLAAVVAAQMPVPPVKPGLWEIRTAGLDANGREIPAPEQAAFARLSPEARAQMAEAMKARGVAMPDANGATKVCFTKETFESGRWQQMAAETGCTTSYSAKTDSMWKWHSSCPARQSEADGEATFTNAENYKVKMTMTMPLNGKPNTSTRIISSKWLGADCGDVKPFTPPAGRK